MTKEECEQLQYLISKLKKELDTPRVLIATGFLQESYVICGYNTSGDRRLQHIMGPTIEDAVNKLKSKV